MTAPEIPKWLQHPAITALLIVLGVGGGYVGGQSTDSYRLDRIEDLVSELASDVRSLREIRGSAWTRDDHDRWERDEFDALEERVRTLELTQTGSK